MYDFLYFNGHRTLQRIFVYVDKLMRGTNFVIQISVAIITTYHYRDYGNNCFTAMFAQFIIYEKLIFLKHVLPIPTGLWVAAKTVKKQCIGCSYYNGFTNTHTYTHAHAHTPHTQTQTHTHAHAHAHAHTHTHTHTHTQTHK